MTELSGEDNNLFGLGGAWWFEPGKRGGDIMSGGAVAFGQTMTPRAEGGLSGRRKEKFVEKFFVTKHNSKDQKHFKFGNQSLGC